MLKDARCLPRPSEEGEADLYPPAALRLFPLPLDVVKDGLSSPRCCPKIEELEKEGEDGFNRYIDHLKSYQLPQPQTDNWC